MEQKCVFVVWVTKLILWCEIKFHRDFQTKFDTKLIYNIYGSNFASFVFEEIVRLNLQMKPNHEARVA